MNYKMISRMTGYILLIEAVTLMPPLILSLFYHESAATRGFGLTLLAVILVGGLLLLPKPEKRRIFIAEGFAITVISWLLMAFFGGMPFFISRTIPKAIDCFFESMSGFTTTGATILKDVEIIPKSLLFWRSFTHWIGGMGVLVFLLAILPNGAGEGYSMHILRAESPGPSVGKLAPKMRKSALILYVIYILLTTILIILLYAGGMPLYDSFCNAMSTAGTGGFGIFNNSIAGYSNYCQILLSVFMVLFGINFSIYYLMLIKNFKPILKDEEFWVYLGVVAVSTIAIFLNILPNYGNTGDALRDSFFQVSSIISTTGFCTADFNQWPDLSRMILILLMFIGSSAGSTGGGLKVSRIVILMKSMKSEISSILHPNAVKVDHLRSKPLSKNLISTVSVYISAVMLIIIGSTLVILISGEDLLTSFTAVVACVFNVGPGLNKVGPISNYAHFESYTKIILSINMLLGRLEVFPLIALFTPTVWKAARRGAPRKDDRYIN